MKICEVKGLEQFLENIEYTKDNTIIFKDTGLDATDALAKYIVSNYVVVKEVADETLRS